MTFRQEKRRVSDMDQTDTLEALRAQEAAGVDDAVDFLNRIVSLHDSVGAATQDASQLRKMFIRHLRHDVDDADQERFGRFLAEHVQPQDFEGIEYDKPRHAALLFELLYRFRYATESRAEQVQVHVESLLKAVLVRFERRDDLESMFKLLQIAPSHSPTDPELVRLRSRAHLYEMRRAARLRRWLYTYMVVQAFLVTLVFPFLFINAENGRIQKELAAAVDVTMESEAPTQILSYIDGLYWSIITAASIGYGDITPGTSIGKVIAAMLGTMGVLTVGVMAGLILFWISPRRLD